MHGAGRVKTPENVGFFDFFKRIERDQWVNSFVKVSFLESCNDRQINGYNITRMELDIFIPHQNKFSLTCNFNGKIKKILIKFNFKLTARMSH